MATIPTATIIIHFGKLMKTENVRETKACSTPQITHTGRLADLHETH